ncbi:WXG100-like domain-containing protein [Streptosporangium sandarakinum]|uniref:Outer membrane channel protein CpnT-like N-terminal domain-containing protein n=1 Tax=Streptosporangium sandarakinum TaxID=1260955 RepID=A0A852V4A0_9ACTN|nr:hypothetical protein [Streptosporangium sandarakinum]NYF42034.1 hypothetical protein [Streptosporangium sandarakinum]
MRLGRPALYPLGLTGMAGLVAHDLYEHWPEGDPEGARAAAAVWRSLGERVRGAARTLDPVAARMWHDHPGQGSTAFRRFWQGGLLAVAALPAGGRDEGVRLSFEEYAGTVVAHCELTAEACEGYAEAVEATRHALKVLAATSMAQLAFAGSWPWLGGPGTAAVKWAAERLYRRIRARLIGQLLERHVAQIVREKAATYVAGSAFFALGDTALSIGTKAAFGDGPGSFEDNAVATMKDFASCLVFFGVWDLTKVGPLSRVFRNNDLGDFASYYVGSTSYTVTYNALSGETGTDLAPTPEQLAGKLFIGTAQRGKAPG